MRLYQKAVDNEAVPFAFLGLWQVLESAVTFRGESPKQADTLHRMNSLLAADSLVQYGLDLFASLRNKLVHEGRFVESGDELLPTLKFFTEITIRTLVNLTDEVPTVHDLKHYLEYVPASAEELSTRSKVISLIEKRRGMTTVRWYPKFGQLVKVAFCS